MHASSPRLASLRELIHQRFPQPSRTAGRALATGIPALDEDIQGLPRGALTELVCAAPSCGGQLFLGRLLQRVREEAGRAALVDGADEFDPDSWPRELLEHLVWVRCRTPGEVMPAADLLARDANLRLLAVDLRRADRAALRGIAPTAWYRLQRAAEQSDLVLLVLTARALVPSAQLRLSLAGSHALARQEEQRESLLEMLPPVVSRQRAMAVV